MNGGDGDKIGGDGDKIVPRCALDLSFDDDILMAESFSSPPMAAPKTCC